MFSSICLHWSLIRLSYLSLLFFGTAFKWIYLSFSPLPFTSFLLSSIFKPPWTTILPFNLYYFLPGASVRNPTHGKGHEEGSPTKRKGVIWLQGFPLSFPEHPPPKTRVGLILLYCAFPLFWHSLEKVNLGLQSSAFERNVSGQTPWDSSLTCLTGSPGLFTTCELFTAPQPWEAQSLKHLKDTEPFLKS